MTYELGGAEVENARCREVVVCWTVLGGVSVGHGHGWCGGVVHKRGISRVRAIKNALEGLSLSLISIRCLLMEVPEVRWWICILLLLHLLIKLRLSDLRREYIGKCIRAIKRCGLSVIMVASSKHI